ncbi:MAG: hypothetical protein JXB39_03195 [Deltaproteobacteria bacterium]|nr:hypothetical protein [Deltaproteobacteria bacterium]
MRLVFPVLVLAACHGKFTETAEALDRYRSGRAHLERGEPVEAAEDFADAARLDPTSVALVAWQAHALAEAGDLEGAVRVLSGQAPSGTVTPLMRYNRACYLARLGRSLEALDSLQRAVQEDPDLVAAARIDPDLVLLAGTPGFEAVVGHPAVQARMAGEEGAILAGETYDLVLEVRGPEGMRLDLTWVGPALPGFEVRRIVDEAEEDGRHRTLTFTLFAGVAGEGTLGPWRLGVSGQALDLPAVAWEVVAPPGATPRTPPVLQPMGPGFWCPAEVLEGRATPSVGTWLGRLLVVHAPSDRVEVDPDAVTGSPLVLEVRRDGQIQAVAQARSWAPDAARAHVRVIAGTDPVLDAVVPAPQPPVRP